jgi:hypothetical protein
MIDGLAWQVLRQRTPRRLEYVAISHWCRRGGIIRLHEGLLLCQILQRQFELSDGAGQSLRGAAELHPPQPGELRLQAGNGRRLHRDHCAHLIRRSRQVQCHSVMIGDVVASHPMTLA